MSTKKVLTLDKAKPLVERVDALRREGKTAVQALSEVGVSDFIYGYWKRRLRDLHIAPQKRGPYKQRRQRAKVEVEIPAPPAHLVRIWGETSAKQMILLSDLAQVA